MVKSKEKLFDPLKVIAKSLRGINAILQEKECSANDAASLKKHPQFKWWLINYRRAELRSMVEPLLNVVPGNVSAIGVTGEVVVFRSEEGLRAIPWGKAMGMTLEEVDQYAQGLAGKIGRTWDPVFPQN